jgi:hypothetical protein
VRIDGTICRAECVAYNPEKTGLICGFLGLGLSVWFLENDQNEIWIDWV